VRSTANFDFVTDSAAVNLSASSLNAREPAPSVRTRRVDEVDVENSQRRASCGKAEDMKEIATQHASEWDARFASDCVKAAPARSLSRSRSLTKADLYTLVEAIDVVNNDENPPSSQTRSELKSRSKSKKKHIKANDKKEERVEKDDFSGK
jgi:hypothetical protein